jgi:hypothetical protein
MSTDNYVLIYNDSPNFDEEDDHLLHPIYVVGYNNVLIPVYIGKAIRDKKTIIGEDAYGIYVHFNDYKEINYNIGFIFVHDLSIVDFARDEYDDYNSMIDEMREDLSEGQHFHLVKTTIKTLRENSEEVEQYLNEEA